MNPVVVQTDNISFLFNSTLMVFNTGNNDSKIFYFAVEQAAVEACEETDAHSHILNCCFKGGCPPALWESRERRARHSDGGRSAKLHA